MSMYKGATGKEGHGLVGYGSDGKIKINVVGHDFGKTKESAKAELEKQIEALLK